MPQIFRRAAELFDQGDVTAAYALYRQAAATYGHEIVAYDLKRCELRLSRTEPLGGPNGYAHAPRVAVLLTSRNNLRTFAIPPTQVGLSYNLRLYFASDDGIRPLHDAQLLDADFNAPQAPPQMPVLPECDYALTINPNDTFTSTHITEYLRFATGIQPFNTTPFRKLDYAPLEQIKDRVTIIIPTYRRPHNLERAIKSVADQNHPDKEVLVVSDNGVPSEFRDQTREVIEKLRGNRTDTIFRLVEHRHNRNGAAARNTGLMQATGEFICFLDDDDAYLPGRLSECIKRLKSVPNHVGAVYCGYRGWNSTDNDIKRYPSGKLTKEILLLAYDKHYLHTNTVTYRRESVYALNGFDETFQRHQDLEFNLRFFESYSTDVVKAILVQLSPMGSTVNNRISGQDLITLKYKFLKRFSHIISSYPSSAACHIFLNHLREVSEKYRDGA